MGQCYYVECKVKIKNEENIVEALQRFMETRDTNFNLEDFASRGIGTNSFDDLMRIIFADFPGNDFQRSEEEGGFAIYSSGFSASYGWESVMDDAFTVMAPFLAEGSELFVEPDIGWWRKIIKNGNKIEVQECDE